MASGARVYVYKVDVHDTPFHRHESDGSFMKSNLTVPLTKFMHAKKVAGHCTV
jgi:hypothetical protein